MTKKLKSISARTQRNIDWIHRHLRVPEGKFVGQPVQLSPAQIEWMRSLKNQCVVAGVPFFLKQMEIDSKLVRMPELDGQIWREIPNE